MKSLKKNEKEKIRKTLSKSHDRILSWINELEFLKDEQVFLEHLLSSHFLDLSTSKLYDPTRKLIRKLKNVEAMGNELSDTIQTHNKQLATLMESLQSKGKKEFKKEHKKITTDFVNYTLNFKYVKRKIFSMIKDIMKIHKQKLLISK